MPQTIEAYGEKLVFVNSVGTLKEWLEGLPIKQSEFDGLGTEELESFEEGAWGRPPDKNEIWELAIRSAGRMIWGRALNSKEIVWHTRPEFVATLLPPDTLSVLYKFRCAFVPKESEDVPA